MGPSIAADGPRRLSTNLFNGVQGSNRLGQLLVRQRRENPMSWTSTVARALVAVSPGNGMYPVPDGGGT